MMDEKMNEFDISAGTEQAVPSAENEGMAEVVAEDLSSESVQPEENSAELKKVHKSGKHDGGITDYGTGMRGFWRKTLAERKYLLICFFLPALLMWLVHITLEVYPFGESSVLVLDLNGQYVYFFEALRDIITDGGSLLYSFRRSLGGDFLGIIGYYIASPFSAIVALFPKSMITEALLVMFLLKTGLCGLTFGIYIEATRKRNRPLTVIFSTMYALCAYAVVMQHNTMWIDNLIWLPLILLGVENIIKNGKYKMFVITLALAITSNFYIGYMTCIFVALYFFYYYFSLDPIVRNPGGVKYHLARTLTRMAVFSVIALLISMVYIWSSYYSLTFGKTTFSNPTYSLTQRFDFLDLFSKMFFGSYDTVRPEGLPFLYSGTLTIILMPLYFVAKKVTTREKIATLFLTLVMVFSFNASTIDLFWHGMQKPNWLNYRYSFMLCFLFLIMAYRAFEDIRSIGFRSVMVSGGVSILLLMILQKIGYENLPDLTAVWTSLGFIILYVLMLRAATWDKKATRRTAVLILTIIVSFEMYAGALVNLMALDEDVVISGRTGYRNFMDRYQPAVDLVNEKDPGFYRMEKLSHRKTNDNMALGMYGVSNSTSTLNSDTIKLLANFGISSKSHWSKYLGGTPVFDSLFGIKYLLVDTDENEQVSELYSYKYGTLEGISAYENPYAMSIAAGVNEALATLDVSTSDSEYKSPFTRMNAVVGAMLGYDEPAELFSMIPTESVDFVGCEKGHLATQEKYSKIDENTEASVTIKFIATNADPVYMFIPSENKYECNLYVNNAQISSAKTYFGNETCRIVEIGSFEEGQEVDVKLVLNKNSTYLQVGCDYFATLDLEACRELLPKLQTSSFEINTHSEDTLIGTIHVLPDQELIYTSLPYDEGWKITANGEEVEIFEIMGGLITFRLDAGSYNLEMKYRPDCAVYGIMISAGGVLIFAAVWVGEWLLKKHRAKKPVPVTVGADSGEELGIAELDLGTDVIKEAADEAKAEEITQTEDKAEGEDEE